MQMRARDSAAYYSCDDHFVVVDKTVDYGRGGSMSDKSSASDVRAKVRPLNTSTAAHMAVAGMFSLVFLKFKFLYYHEAATFSFARHLHSPS